MKKLLSLLLIAVFIFALSACESSDTAADKLRIVTTIFPQYDFARAVSAETPCEVELTMLLPPGSESHDYEPSLADLAVIEGCDLFISVGRETDAWVESAIEAVGGDVNVLRLTDLVPLLTESEDGILEHDHNHENDHHHDEEEECHDHHEGFDEHVWTSPANAAILTEAICDAMSALRPDLAGSFKRSADIYVAKLRELDENFSKAVQGAQSKTLVFADRFPFRYFTDRYGLSHVAAFSGCSSDSEPALSTIYDLTEKAKNENARAILVCEFSSKSAAKVISAECSADILEMHSCHNVSKEDFDRGVTYAELMEKNLSTIEKALN